jgi:hypothetical protein
MDNEFIGPRELALAAVGIGMAVLLLLFLQFYKRSRARRAGEERLRIMDSVEGGGKDAPPGTIPFFIASFNGAYARFFRVYCGADELLFVYAGQFFFMIDDDSPRASDQGHWLLRSVKLMFTGLAAVAVLGGFGLAAMFRAVTRSAAENPDGAIDIVMIVFGVIVFCAGIVVIGIPLTLWTITRRCRQLNEMSLDRLRRESELHGKSLRATPDTVKDVKLTLHNSKGDLLPSSQIASMISFKHSSTGYWSIDIRSTRDTRDAIKACVAVWGQEHVQIDQKLLDRLGGSLAESR